MDIYRQEIIDHYQNPRNFGKLKNPTVFHEEVNSFCGDRIRMELQIVNDKIMDVAISGAGCAISMASASFLTEMIKNQTINKVKKNSKEELVKKLNINLSPSRLVCAWLPWEVLHKALFKYQNMKGAYGKI
jgi:nitrogen fixation NifU-like protein